jgi:hypothetical protein
VAPLAAGLGDASIKRFGGNDFGGRRLGAGRHIADDMVVFPNRHDTGLDPIMIAIFSPVLDDAAPGKALINRAPQAFEGGGRHIGMAHQVMVLTNQFLTRKARKRDKSIVCVGNDALQISLGNEVFATRIRNLTLRHRLVIFHVSRSKGSHRW